MIAGLAVSLISLGCDQPGGNFKTAEQLKQERQAAGKTDHHDDHDHSAGPHGGSIVELGDEEYHAEVVVDGKSHTLRVYLFGTDAKTPAPIAAAEVTVTVEDGPKLSLKAAPQTGDGEGKSSLFELSDETAVGAIAKAGFLHGSLQLETDGKPYRGDIDAHFDGTAHDDHADHKDEEKKDNAGAAAVEKPADEAAPKDATTEK